MLMRTLRSSPVAWAVLLAAVALVLGYAGYRTADVPLSRSDALFSALQLFALEGGVPEGGTPWALNLARFLAPLSVVYATVATMVTILRDQVQRTVVSVTAKNHVLLIGLSRSTQHLAVALRREGRQVVVVEADPTNKRMPGLRAEGAQVLVGDGRQEVILRQVHVERADHVVVTTGDDSRNLEIADLVRRIASTSDRRRPTVVQVAIDDTTLWVELGRGGWSWWVPRPTW
jgi:hypothetical protein